MRYAAKILAGIVAGIVGAWFILYGFLWACGEAVKAMGGM